MVWHSTLVVAESLLGIARGCQTGSAACLLQRSCSCTRCGRVAVAAGVPGCRPLWECIPLLSSFLMFVCLSLQLDENRNECGLRFPGRCVHAAWHRRGWLHGSVATWYVSAQSRSARRPTMRLEKGRTSTLLTKRQQILRQRQLPAVCACLVLPFGHTSAAWCALDENEDTVGGR